MRPPSNGGIGSKFKNPKTKLMIMPALADNQKNKAITECSGWDIIASFAIPVQVNAIRKFDSGPAKATRISSRLRFLNKLGLIGTGFAQPKAKLKCEMTKITMGTKMVPIRSICLMGFMERRPSALAVESPQRAATQAWDAS